jgi:hypothetical protein
MAFSLSLKTVLKNLSWASIVFILTINTRKMGLLLQECVIFPESYCVIPAKILPVRFLRLPHA